MKINKEKDLFVVIGGIKWVPFVTRNLSFWHQSLSDMGIFHGAKYFGLFPKSQLFVTINGTETHIFSNAEKLEDYGASILHIIETKKKIKELENKYKIFASQLLKATEECIKTTTPKTWEKFTDIYSCFCAGLALTAYLGVIGSEKLVSRLKELGFNEQEIPNIISTITYPDKHTPLFKSQLDLLDIAKDIKSKRLSKTQTENKLKLWLVKYSHIPVNFCDKPWTLSDVKEQLNSLILKNCKKEIDLLQKNHKLKIAKRKETLKKIKDDKISLLAYGLQTGTCLNEFRKNIFSKVSLDIRSVFKKVAEKADLESWNQCHFLTSEEIRDIIQGKNISANKIISQRMIVGMKMGLDGKQTFLTKHELNKFIHLINDIKGRSYRSQESKSSIINGFSANKGIAKGIAKVILSSKEFDKLLPGEILVAIMTSVDFTPIMEKASAFVTNEGGITSHAAIVAREMNKPCIIGTKIATKVIKDGDFIEVDANNGVVKILKRS